MEHINLLSIIYDVSAKQLKVLNVIKFVLVILSRVQSIVSRWRT
jgi:hypothetical protein